MGNNFVKNRKGRVFSLFPLVSSVLFLPQLLALPVGDRVLGYLCLINSLMW